MLSKLRSLFKHKPVRERTKNSSLYRNDLLNASLEPNYFALDKIDPGFFKKPEVDALTQSQIHQSLENIQISQTTKESNADNANLPASAPPPITASKQESNWIKEVIDKPQEKATVKSAKAKERKPIKNYIAITIKARSATGFLGPKLEDALNKAQFIYNPQDKLFEKFEKANTSGLSIIQLYNAEEPGIFASSDLSSIQVRAITLFMLTSRLNNRAFSYDSLIKTSKQLSFVLNGELLDKNYKPLTLNTIEQYKQELFDPA